jgi:hypothetical protein
MGTDGACGLLFCAAKRSGTATGTRGLVSCHGGLYAHNIEYDLVSHWEKMFFLSIWPWYYAPYPPRHHQDWGRARAAGSRFARDDKEPGPSWGKQLLEERPRETAETWHTSPQPSRHVRRKGAAPLSGAEEQTARATSAHAQCACLLPLQMGYKLD